MEIQKFEEILEKTKPSSIITAQFKDLKLKTNHEHTVQIVYTEELCKSCNRSLSSKKVGVEFFKPHQLTIFEAVMLYMVFVDNKMPRDYARFHKCPAGKEFVENIKEIRVGDAK